MRFPPPATLLGLAAIYLLCQVLYDFGDGARLRRLDRNPGRPSSSLLLQRVRGGVRTRKSTKRTEKLQPRRDRKRKKPEASLESTKDDKRSKNSPRLDTKLASNTTQTKPAHYALQFEFTLKSGQYATMLMREIMRNDLRGGPVESYLPIRYQNSGRRGSGQTV